MNFHRQPTSCTIINLRQDMDVNENIGKILILRRVLDGYSRICDASPGPLQNETLITPSAICGYSVPPLSPHLQTFLSSKDIYLTQERLHSVSSQIIDTKAFFHASVLGTFEGCPTRNETPPQRLTRECLEFPSLFMTVTNQNPQKSIRGEQINTI